MAKLNILRIFGIFLVLNLITVCVFLVYRYYDNKFKDLKAESFQRSGIFRYGDKYVLIALGFNGSYRQSRYKYFTGEYVLNRTPVNVWVDKEHTKEFCDGRIIIYHDKFAIIRNVVMFPLRRIGSANQAKGGEEIRFVLNQGLERENYMFQQNFFEINCKSSVNLNSYSGSIRLLNALKVNINKKTELNFVENKNSSKIEYVITVQREDYANLHNWARNIYDTFLVMMHFKVQPSQVKIMFMDGHPATELDKAWSVIYNPPLRVGHLTNPVKIQNLIFGIDEKVGLVSEYRNEHVPFLEDFRSFVLSQFDLPDDATLNCLKLRITIILRRNAVYHPRNVMGNVGRKFFNEAPLINDLMSAFPNAVVTSVLMESLPMRIQLLQISQSDVLIGMHGAGMTHVLFLPKHAAILEMFSKDFKVNRPWYRCYQSIATWRKMTYESWENFDRSLEMPADFTIIPTSVVVNKTKILVNSICKHTIEALKQRNIKN